MHDITMKEPMSAIDIVLIHHPVLGKKGETISSAVTNLDLHDIARAAKTFGVDNYYIVTPFKDQQVLVQEIIDHWQTGHGAKTNPARRAAFDLVRVASSLEDVIETIETQNNIKPVLFITSAKRHKKSITYPEARKVISLKTQALLLFGTAHGLTQEMTDNADYILPPIGGKTTYNHLSVRSAVSIILDRLLGT